jgi:hypothetical protein
MQTLTDFASNTRAIPATYRELVRDPRKVCDDRFYGLMHAFPGHPAFWAVLLGIALPVITASLQDIGGPIKHVRSPTELHASYFFGPVIVVQVVIMPLLYRAALVCLEHLRRAFPVSDTEFAGLRELLIRPGTRFQTRLLFAAIIATLLVQQVSSSRLSRYVTGDWNSFDIWLTFSAVLTFVMFLWFLILPVSRTLVLAQIIDNHLRPELFDESLGRPIATYGLRAGLVFAIPYAVVNSASVTVLSDAWALILPAIVGAVVAIAFTLIPGYRLREKIRAAKKAELAWLQTAIGASHAGLHGDRQHGDELRRLVDLVNYRQQVMAVREWPVEAKFIRGFGLYFLLIPLTWVASAMVELVIEKLGVIG